MSGTNPFRRQATADQSFKSPSTPVNHVPTTTNPDSGIPPIDTARAIKTKSAKTVRIISPHSAEEHDPIPDEVYDLPRRPIFSPPPDSTPGQSTEDESPEDPFAADSEGAGSGTEDEGTAQQISSGMPANPFKKTLANIETQDSPSSGRSVMDQKPSSSGTRPQYDVDDFKKLLLTGEKNAPKSSPIRTAPLVSFSQIQNGDSNSITDASSASRQSIFEAPSNVRHESPQTSRESSISDDEGQDVPQSPGVHANKPKPSTPAHRYGKPMQSNHRPSATLEDLTSPIAKPAIITPVSGNQITPVSPSSPGDRNKALPVLPLSSTLSHSVTGEIKGRPESFSDPKEDETSSKSYKKPAPNPPPSRRTRPMSIGSMHSGRSIPISEEPPSETLQLASSPPNRASNAPAPPPPRRSNTLRRDSSSSMPIVASQPSVSDQPVSREHSPTPVQKANPPIPLTRSPSSQASKDGTRTSPASGKPTMTPQQPPPPPPPRRRGSSQSSNHYTPSRLSGNYTMPMQERLRSDSGASSLSQTPMTNTEPRSDEKVEQKDVLADLTALQREVDELRGKMR